MSDEKREYKIGTKTFTQRRLVLGQLDQLLELFADLGLVVDEKFEIMDCIKKLGSSTSKLLAIILIEDGVELENRDLQATENFIRFNFSDFEMAEKIIKDFFVVTPIFSLLKLLPKVMLEISGTAKKELENLQRKQ